jgi:hypothetical protein
MRKPKIPDEVKKQANEIVARFNETEIRDSRSYYLTRYRGQYLYLDRVRYGEPSPICRLTYTGEMDAWEFAIYRYSKERYDADEWLIPGFEHFDGTIGGALRWGLEAYPDTPEISRFWRFIFRFLLRRLS